MPLILTRKQSMWLGLGLLGSFFLVSGAIIYQRNQARIPTQDASLSKEAIEGAPDLAPTSAPQNQETPAAGVGFVLNQFHRSLVRDGKIVWEIFGKKGVYDAASNKAHVDSPDLTVIRDNGDIIHLTADRADISLAGTDLSKADLFDNVVVTYKGNTTIKTSRASYDKTTGRVEIPVPMELDGPMFNVQGNSSVALVEPQEITIRDGVHTIIKPRTK